jgi:molecular chaperone DnaK
VKKARAVVERTRQAIAAKDLTTLTEATEALNRTLNMFRGVVSKTRG